MKSEDLRAELAEKDAQLVRLNHSLEKLKSELAQKEEQVKQKDAELTRRSKEIQRLDEKIHKVDSLTSELLETQEQKGQLKTHLRDMELELGQVKRQLETVKNEGKAAALAEQKMRQRCESLWEQLRLEIERTAELEERARDSEEAVAARPGLLVELGRLGGAAKDADRLVAASRRVQRQLADQLASVRAELQQMRTAASAQAEAADANVAELRQDLAESAACGERHRRAASGLRRLLVELRSQFPGVGPSIDAQLASASCSDGSWQGGRLLKVRAGGSAPRVRRARTASRGSGFVEAITSACASSQTASRADADESLRSESVTIATVGTASCASDAATSEGSRGTSQRDGISLQLRDRVAALYIHLGDRVSVRLQGATREDQREAEAIVKFIGPASSGNGTVHYGLKLVDKGLAAAANAGATGDFRFDLLVRAGQLRAIFSRQKNIFRKLEDLIKDYLD